jgi:hypothetical protein
VPSTTWEVLPGGEADGERSAPRGPARSTPGGRLVEGATRWRVKPARPRGCPEWHWTITASGRSITDQTSQALSQLQLRQGSVGTCPRRNNVHLDCHRWPSSAVRAYNAPLAVWDRHTLPGARPVAADQALNLTVARRARVRASEASAQRRTSATAARSLMNRRGLDGYSGHRYGPAQTRPPFRQTSGLPAGTVPRGRLSTTPRLLSSFSALCWPSGVWEGSWLSCCRPFLTRA